MPKYKFEIIATYEGKPGFGFLPPGLSQTKELDGDAMVVVMEFKDEEHARRQECTHDTGYNSAVWWEHCPPENKDGCGEGGLDVRFISMVSEEEADQIELRNSLAFHEHKFCRKQCHCV